jgi:hypothetical protein
MYTKLAIIATDPTTEIWLGDDQGFFVQKGIGRLFTMLSPGSYVVEFELGKQCYPITLLDVKLKFTQSELESGPKCERPRVNLDVFGENDV